MFPKFDKEIIFLHRKMASKEDKQQLTRKQIVRLSASISANNMMGIAKGYMDIEATIQNKKFETKEDAQAFNRAIIKTWLYKNPHNQVEVSLQRVYQICSGGSKITQLDDRKLFDQKFPENCMKMKEIGPRVGRIFDHA